MRRLSICRDDPHAVAAGDGTPLFLLGDTAWELLHRLTREEMVYYLDKRASQGFNLICTVVLAEFQGLTSPNAEGHLPLIDLDPRRLSEPYFDLVDYFIEEALKRSIYVGLLPTWGDKLTAPWGAGPRIFGVGDTSKAYSFGQNLGARYRTSPNILWVLGGDRPANLAKISADWPYPWEAGFTPDTDWEPLWAAMAQGIRSEIPSALMAYHPQGGALSTSQLLPDAAWLDLNMLQSGHGGGHDVPVWDLISRDYAVEPPKPTLDAEPNYEDHPVSPWPTWDPANGYFDDYDVRKQCYRSVFAGGCGVVYGHGSVWQFWDGTREPIMMPRFHWREALDRPGACQLGFLKQLIDEFGEKQRVPCDAIVTSDLGVGRNRKVSTQSSDGELAYVYTPTSGELRVRLPSHLGERSTLTWICPRTFSAIAVSHSHRPSEEVLLNPPTTSGPDWVLRIERAES